MSTLTAALRRYARARRHLTEVARLQGPETEEHEQAVGNVIDALGLVPLRLLWVARAIDRHVFRQAGIVTCAPVYRTRLPGIPAALRRCAAAERELCLLDIAEWEAGTEGETPAFLDAGDEATAALASVPWWLLWAATLAGNRIARQLDYYGRTGQPDDCRPARSPLAWWATLLLVNVAVVAGTCFIAHAVTRPALPAPVPTIFTPAPVAPASQTPGCAP